MQFTFNFTQFVQVVGFLLLLVSSGIAIRATTINSAAKSWKEVAEALGAKVKVLEDEQNKFAEKLKASEEKQRASEAKYEVLSADHNKLKGQHIEVLNENRGLLRAFVEEVRRDIRVIREDIGGIRHLLGDNVHHDEPVPPLHPPPFSHQIPDVSGK